MLKTCFLLLIIRKECLYLYIQTLKKHKMKTRKEQAKQVRELLSIIEDRKTDMLCLKNGLIMSSDLFRKVLKEFPQLKEEWDILRRRQFSLERKLWEVA